MTGQKNQKRALVTGGRAGIGRAIADRLSEAGWRVFICGPDAEGLARSLEEAPHLRGAVCDVGDPAQVDELFDAVQREFGGLDALVNNAGISGATAPVDEISLDDWARTLAVNLSGPFYCARKAAPLMKAQKSGSIINISTTSVRVALPQRAPYVASKAGLHGLTRTLARELGPFNIRCNTISPGMIDNPRGARVRAERAAAQGLTPEELLDYRLGFISMRAMARPEEVADLAVFLSSDAGRHISGQEISVCGNLEWE